VVISIIGPFSSNNQPRTRTRRPASALMSTPAAAKPASAAHRDAEREVAPQVVAEVRVPELVRPLDPGNPPLDQREARRLGAHLVGGMRPLPAPCPQSPVRHPRLLLRGEQRLRQPRFHGTLRVRQR
jgi:hypothetical protein